MRISVGFVNPGRVDFGGWLAGIGAASSRAAIAAGFAGKRLF